MEEIQEERTIEDQIYEFGQTHYWKDIIKPEFEGRIAEIDARMIGETDPWKRYGLVEAYKYMALFKLWFDDIIEQKGD